MADQTLKDLPYDSIVLEISSGPAKGRTFSLKAGENIIGRAAEAEVQLEDNAVSRQHTAITVEGEDIKVQDMGSAQGTVLNGRLLMGADFLFDNDEIRVGPYTLRISIVRQESRSGILFALACLGVAVVVLMIAFMVPTGAAFTSSGNGAATDSERVEPSRDWRNWENLVLPSAKQLADEGLPTEDLTQEEIARQSENQFQLGSRLYQDRLGDLGNAYRALIHFKRAVALATMVTELEKRPAVANRSLERIVTLRDLIKDDCEKRVFAYQQKLKVGWFGECKRVLNEIMVISPWAGSRHNRWAAQKLEELDRMLNG